MDDMAEVETEDLDEAYFRARLKVWEDGYRAEGREQGREQGRAEGERAVLERQLRRRFGQLDPHVGVRLGEATAGELMVWAENVLDAATLDEVFRSGQ